MKRPVDLCSMGYSARGLQTVNREEQGIANVMATMSGMIVLKNITRESLIEICTELGAGVELGMGNQHKT